MSRTEGNEASPAGGWLEGNAQGAWLAYIRVQLRLAYEMNRQLLADSGMSLPDYDVLTALSVADGGQMQITVLAAQIGWERSRASHHVRRMSARGLVSCALSAADRRVTEVTLTSLGRQALQAAAPGHADLVSLPGEGRSGSRSRPPTPHRRLESGGVHQRIVLVVE
jgi:DNA-binding MarR family transcriptional regulator